MPLVLVLSLGTCTARKVLSELLGSPRFQKKDHVTLQNLRFARFLTQKRPGRHPPRAAVGRGPDLRRQLQKNPWQKKADTNHAKCGDVRGIKSMRWLLNVGLSSHRPPSPGGAPSPTPLDPHLGKDFSEFFRTESSSSSLVLFFVRARAAAASASSAEPPAPTDILQHVVDSWKPWTQEHKEPREAWRDWLVAPKEVSAIWEQTLAQASPLSSTPAILARGSSPSVGRPALHHYICTL